MCPVLGLTVVKKEEVCGQRIKGKTENELLKLPFKEAYMFRPGYIQPTKGLNNSYKVYKVLAPLYPLWKIIFPKHVVF